MYVPNKEVSVDKDMLKFKGGLYMPSKPSCKWRVKVCSLCNSKTGYLLKFNVYTGKSNIDVEQSLGSKVVLTLLTVMTSELYAKIFVTHFLQVVALNYVNGYLIIHPSQFCPLCCLAI